MPKKSQKEIRTAIKSYLSEQEKVSFAYLFGSFVTEKTFRDIDIAAYLHPKPDLIDLGHMQSQLEELTPEIPIDLLLLNNTETEKPYFAHRVITKGELLLNKDQERHAWFKKKTMQIYFDTAYLRRLMDEAFKKRLENGAFGARDYA